MKYGSRYLPMKCICIQKFIYGWNETSLFGNTNLLHHLFPNKSVMFRSSVKLIWQRSKLLRDHTIQIDTVRWHHAKRGKWWILYTNLAVAISFNLEINQTVQHQPFEKKEIIFESNDKNITILTQHRLFQVSNYIHWQHRFVLVTFFKCFIYYYYGTWALWWLYDTYSLSFGLPTCQEVFDDLKWLHQQKESLHLF
jgi:hypothetical protein